MTRIRPSEQVAAIQQRLKHIRLEWGLTQLEMGEKMGRSLRGYQEYECGRKSIPNGLAIGALVRQGINANWLLAGDGPMMLEKTRFPADRLSLIIEAVEFALNQQRRVLPPKRKAQLIESLYALCDELDAPPGRSTIIRLLNALAPRNKTGPTR